METIQLTYYPDITQGQPAAKVHEQVGVFAKALGTQLSKDLGTQIQVQLLDVLSVSDQYEHILRGDAAIGLLKPVAYVFAHQRNPNIVPACVAHRPIDGKVGTTYFAQIYARSDLGLTSLADLRKQPAGKLSIAYGDRFSTSNFLIPAHILYNDAAVHPFLFFKKIFFAGGHDLAAEAVYRGEADIGGGHDGVIKILSETYPDAEEKLIRLGREDIHSDPVVVNKSELPKSVTLENVQSACTTIAKQPEVAGALDLFWGWVKDLSPTKHENYASIEAALKALNLTEKDMIT
jgi:phosphonate transport system substrate-binding protein